MPPGRGRAARLLRLELRDVRPFAEAVLEPEPEGTTVLTGPNGCGKTTFLEAVAYLATQRSFRTSTRDAMIRVGAERSVIRADLEREGRPVLVESELPPSGPARTQVNRQPVRSRRDLSLAVPITVFSPEDLALVQGPPAHRRDLLDDAIRLMDAQGAADLDDLERVLRQRGALLRQAAGRLNPEIASTLDVWDDRLRAAGEAVAQDRSSLVGSLEPLVASVYASFSSAGVGVTVAYQPSWSGSLADALAAARADDVRRGVTTVGPHRDDLLTRIDGRDARIQASQGEQRTLALAFRLAMHRLVAERSGVPPMLLLDDVFSELDEDRSRALVRRLPIGQALLTTAVPLPPDVAVAKVVDVRSIGERR